MKPTSSYDDMIMRRISTDRDFAVALLKSSLGALFEGDFHYALKSLHSLVKAGMGFAALSEAVGISSQNLHRALSERGNPTIKTLNRIVAAIATSLDVKLVAA